MRDGGTTNRRIRETALRLFVERGVDAVSVRDITDAVGIRPSTLYVHWRSRDELIRALFVEGYAQYATAMAEEATRPVPTTERLAAIIRRVCGFYGDDPLLFQFLLLTQHSNLPAVTEEAGNPIVILQRLVAEGVAEGAFAHRDPALLTAGIVGLIVQTATFHHYGRVAAGLPSLTDEIVVLARKLVALEPLPE